MLIPLALCASVGAFAPSQSSLRHTRIPGPLSAFEDPGEASVAEETIDKPAVLPMKRSGTVMSESIPFLRCPAVLVDCDLAGNVGFDPLGLAKNKELLMEYREAEIKHARLAMLVRKGILGFRMVPLTRSEMKMDWNGTAADFCLLFLKSIVIAYRRLPGGLFPNCSIDRLQSSLGSRRSLIRQIGCLLFSMEGWNRYRRYGGELVSGFRLRSICMASPSLVQGIRPIFRAR
jgi:hypothetical protein